MYRVHSVTQMMYGAGEETPYAESIKLLNDLAIDYMTEMSCKAMTIGKVGQIDVQDFLYLTRKDPIKHGRIQSLIEVNEDLKNARRAFDVNSMAAPESSGSEKKKKNKRE